MYCSSVTYSGTWLYPYATYTISSICDGDEEINISR